MTDLKPCPVCGRPVKIRQMWHFQQQTWLEIHCRCGRHMRSERVYRGEPMPSREELARRWNNGD